MLSCSAPSSAVRFALLISCMGPVVCAHQMAARSTYKVLITAALWTVHSTASFLGIHADRSHTLAAQQDVDLFSVRGEARNSTNAMIKERGDATLLDGKLSSAVLRGLRSSVFANTSGGRILQHLRGTSAGTKYSRPTCAPLSNMGSHFVIQIGVGTPMQRFEVVADTGSNAVIIPSCVCKQNSYQCSIQDSCFKGGDGRSSTFVPPSQEEVIVLSFGSGDIISALATDIVRVGELQAYMKEGVLLMVDRKLDIEGKFEGILGLGLPPPPGADPDPWVHKTYRQTSSGAAVGRQVTIPHFLDVAGVDQFSICLGDWDQNGVVRFEPMAAARMLPQIGKMHWGLGLTGIGVGVAGRPHTAYSAPVSVCKEADTKPGMDTPCGAIPDSGTTLIMGPQAEILTLFASLCSQWPRCDNQASSSGNYRSFVFQSLLMECEEWLDQGEGLEEIPSLYWRMTGKNGEVEVVEMHAYEYIIQVEVPNTKEVTKKLLGIIPVRVEVDAPGTKRICQAAFGEVDYATAKNGPVWIVGMPLFFEYEVVFGRGVPTTIGFKKHPRGSCGSCNVQLPGVFANTSDLGAAVLTNASKASAQLPLEKRNPRPRVLRKPPRIPRWLNPSVPL